VRTGEVDLTSVEIIGETGSCPSSATACDNNAYRYCNQSSVDASLKSQATHREEDRAKGGEVRNHTPRQTEVGGTEVGGDNGRLERDQLSDVGMATDDTYR
jgi:hypothetical protein